MKGFILSLFLVAFAVVSVSHAKPVVESEIIEISKHKLLVTFAWKVTVRSEKAWDVCDLTISFRDGGGKEIYAVNDRLKIKAGANSFAGHEICDIETWDRIKKYVTKLDCVF